MQRHPPACLIIVKVLCFRSKKEGTKPECLDFQGLSDLVLLSHNNPLENDSKYSPVFTVSNALNLKIPPDAKKRIRRYFVYLQSNPAFSGLGSAQLAALSRRFALTVAAEYFGIIGIIILSALVICTQRKLYKTVKQHGIA